jgi:glycosyltransferase involved in cell wall biosynthesis
VTFVPRVAFFCETFHEVNGVALTARQFVAFAQRQARPLLAVHGGATCATFQEGSVSRIQIRRGRLSFGIERDLRYDMFLWRRLPALRKALAQFKPDVIHVTSPGEFGQLGAWLAHRLRVPLVASWHTNLHQFAARRLEKLMHFAPSGWTRSAHDWAERNALAVLIRFYKLASATLAPTPAQVDWLQRATGHPSFLMPRGVDTERFSPRHRTVNDTTLRVGFVGRVTPEKNVRFLINIEEALLAAGHTDFLICVIGDGSERQWLERNLRHGVFTGVLRDEKLAAAYANLDLFVFPSRTDTFGNVILEAAASGVPAVVTSEGGPKDLVLHGLTGYVAHDDADFIAKVLELAADRGRLPQMGRSARDNASHSSWDTACEMIYAAYRHAVALNARVAPARISAASAGRVMASPTTPER